MYCVLCVVYCVCVCEQEFCRSQATKQKRDLEQARLGEIPTQLPGKRPLAHCVEHVKRHNFVAKLSCRNPCVFFCFLFFGGEGFVFVLVVSLGFYLVFFFLLIKHTKPNGSPKTSNPNKEHKQNKTKQN